VPILDCIAFWFRKVLTHAEVDDDFEPPENVPAVENGKTVGEKVNDSGCKDWDLSITTWQL
jgi:hypothetical protein